MQEFKFIYLLGHLKDNDPDVKGILKLDKMSFNESIIAQLGQDDSNLILDENHYFQNDIYSKFMLNMTPEISKIQCDFIYPAPQSQIDKYTAQVYHIILETPEMHFKFVKPLYIEKLEKPQWLYNVLDGVKEVELMKFKNEHFLLQQDYKVNSNEIQTLHLLAIPYDRTITSIRDLNETHLDMLKSIRDDSYRTIKEVYGLDKSQIRALFHYYPTFYHLHVHFVHASQIEKCGAFLGKGQLLEDVIDNIEIKGDYYQTKTIQAQVGESHQIYKILIMGGQV
eukprot:403377407